MVAPPGSGKTVIGLEIVRRLGRPALVLAPTATIQAQWREKLALFAGDPGTLCGDGGPLHVLTYQSICQTADPGGALRDDARDRLVAERASATGAAPETAAAEVTAFAGARRSASNGPRRRGRAHQAGRRARRASRPRARASARPGARRRIEGLVAGGVGTLVLDECHHLASLWGYLVRTAIVALGDVHVVGLTATPPAELSGDEPRLRRAARPGRLRGADPGRRARRLPGALPGARALHDAAGERSAPAGRAPRPLREMLDRLHDPPPPGEEDLAFGPWVIGRLRYRDTGDGAARVAFATLAAAARTSPAPAALPGRRGLDLPDDAPRGEGWREPPTLDDWLVLIGDYAVGCLRAAPGEAADRRFADLQTALRDLGFVLTRQGVRRGGSEADRVLHHQRREAARRRRGPGRRGARRGGEGLRAVVLSTPSAASASRRPRALALSGGARRRAAHLRRRRPHRGAAPSRRHRPDRRVPARRRGPAGGRPGRRRTGGGRRRDAAVGARLGQPRLGRGGRPRARRRRRPRR